jgi:hypothetical protein
VIPGDHKSRHNFPLQRHLRAGAIKIDDLMLPAASAAAGSVVYQRLSGFSFRQCLE